MTDIVTDLDIYSFWFETLTPDMWFKKSLDLDSEIKIKFEPTHTKAQSGELYPWRATPRGRLAEIIVLDQFSRNIYRDSKKAFTTDTVALVLAQEAVSLKVDQALSGTEKGFLYMPYMHSESALIHKVAVELFSTPGLENNLAFELKHKKIIDQFGRYPHRNKTLGRHSTKEELEFLKQPGSSF